MLEWALRYYNDLPENNLEEKARIESTWFHDLFIAQLIERNETETLTRLFNTLPASHFSSFTNLIIKHWPEWPAPLANAAIHILAVNAPQALLNLLDDYLKQNSHFDFERILNITVFTEIGIDTSWQPILNRLSQKVLAFNFVKTLRAGAKVCSVFTKEVTSCLCAVVFAGVVRTFTFSCNCCFFNNFGIFNDNRLR